MTVFGVGLYAIATRGAKLFLSGLTSPGPSLPSRTSVMFWSFTARFWYGSRPVPWLDARTRMGLLVFKPSRFDDTSLMSLKGGRYSYRIPYTIVSLGQYQGRFGGQHTRKWMTSLR